MSQRSMWLGPPPIHKTMKCLGRFTSHGGSCKGTAWLTVAEAVAANMLWRKCRRFMKHLRSNNDPRENQVANYLTQAARNSFPSKGYHSTVQGRAAHPGFRTPNEVANQKKQACGVDPTG